jgi:hypothetical protein
MTRKQRIARIKSRVYDPRKCTDCRGSGTVLGRRPGTMGSGCATCAFGNVMGTRLSARDFNWLIRQAERVDRHANAR